MKNFDKILKQIKSASDKSLKQIMPLVKDYINSTNDLSNIFISGNNLKRPDMSSLDTSNVVNISRMFSNCSSLTSLDLSSFNTSKVTNMNGIFEFCNSLISLNLSTFDTSNVTDMSQMFEDCKKLASLDLSNFNTSNVFSGCEFLTSLDISSFDFSNVKNVEDMFIDCENLANLEFGKNLKKSIDLHFSPLTHESVLSVIDGLAEVEEQQTLKLSTFSIFTLAESDVRKAEDKNWKIIALPPYTTKDLDSFLFKKNE